MPRQCQHKSWHFAQLVVSAQFMVAALTMVVSDIITIAVPDWVSWDTDQRTKPLLGSPLIINTCAREEKEAGLVEAEID